MAHKAEMYNYLGGVKNDKRSDALDVAFKQEKSNFHVAIVVDMWITGFDVPALTYEEKLHSGEVRRPAAATANRWQR